MTHSSSLSRTCIFYGCRLLCFIFSLASIVFSLAPIVFSLAPIVFSLASVVFSLAPVVFSLAPVVFSLAPLLSFLSLEFYNYYSLSRSVINHTHLFICLCYERLSVVFTSYRCNRRFISFFIIRRGLIGFLAPSSFIRFRLQQVLHTL